jgi:hypothetical protein
VARLEHDRILGRLQFEEKEFKVLNRPLPESLTDKYLQYITQQDTIITTSWMMHKCKWKIEKDNLYLTEMFQTHLLKKFVEKEEVLATWVDELLLHKATEIIISSKNILRKENIYYSELRFKGAKLLGNKQKVSTIYPKGSKKSTIQGHCQEGIFTFDREDIICDNKNLTIKGRDEIISYLEQDINDMLKKSHKGINLNIVDMKNVLKKSTQVTYLCEGFFLGNKKQMATDINEIFDRINIVTKKRRVNYLVHIDIDKGFPFDIVKNFMERMLDICDDCYCLIGFNEHKKIKGSKKKKDIFEELDEVKPCVVFKVLMGVS